jgi:hypothetical protein
VLVSILKLHPLLSSVKYGGMKIMKNKPMPGPLQFFSIGRAQGNYTNYDVIGFITLNICRHGFGVRMERCWAGVRPDSLQTGFFRILMTASSL